MSEVTPTPELEQSPSEGVNSAQTLGGETDTPSGSRRNPTRAPRRPNTAFNNTPRDFDGVTPKIGGILALRSENMTKKVNYDIWRKCGRGHKKPNDRHYFVFRERK